MAKTKVELQNYQGESLSPITIASNVLYEDGRNAQEVFEEYSNETFTPTIENSSSMFKVGQGDNVDYSANVVNGAYESMVLKGKSMVNCIQESSSQDVVLPYEFEDSQYVTINDTKESGALGVELKGQTLVNISKIKTATGFVQNILTMPIKGNTNYIFIADVDNSSKVQFNGKYVFSDGTSGGDFLLVSRSKQDGRVYTTFKCSRDDAINMNVYVVDSETIVVDNIMILEYQEGMENWDIPYFTGMASCKMPILHSVNQMFDYSCATKPTNTGTISFTNDGRTLKTNFNVVRDCVNVTNITLPAGTYEVSYEIRGSVTLPEGVSLASSRAGLTFFRSSEAWSSCRETLMINYATIDSVNYTKATKTFTFDEPITVAVVYHGWNNSPVGWCELTDIRIVSQGKSSILSLPEEVVLRSLPNGVRDTFNTRTGVYTQRIGEVFLNGSESWAYNPAATDKTLGLSGFSLSVTATPDRKWYGATLCDKMPVITSLDKVGVYNGQGLNILIKSDSTNVNTLKEILAKDPITVQYELENPIVIKINLSSTLKSWNTTTHIYSEIPENTLYPILSHSNPTYPVILKPSTKYSIVANSYSNNHTNSPINFNLGGTTVSTTVGNRVTTITTPSTLSNELLTMSGRGNKLSHVMVIEGDVVGDEPYFEGICDCKSPILSNVGENLFNVNNHTENQWSFSSGYPYEQNTSYGDRLRILGDEIHFSTDGGTVNKGVGYYIPLCKNKDYTFRINKKDGNGNYCVKLFLIHSSEHPLKKSIQQHSKFGINNETIASSLEANFNSANYDMCAIYIGGGWESGTHATRSYVFNNISLTESSQQVEPYKSNTITFDQKDDKTIVLRSLPNGVCDTLNVETGEYVQRIGELVADGSNIGYKVNGIGVGEMDTFRFQLSDPSIKNVPEVKGNLICDQLPWRVIWSASVERTIGCYAANSENRIIVRMLKEKFDTLNVDGINRYLTNNPITFQYELATPIVTTIDVQGFPYAYTNGHVQLSSGSIEQSLTPTVEYSVATNRNGQIRTNQKMVEKHQKQLDQLQAIILANMVNTQYQQTLTTLNYDLLKKEVGE